MSSKTTHLLLCLLALFNLANPAWAQNESELNSRADKIQKKIEAGDYLEAERSLKGLDKGQPAALSAARLALMNFETSAGLCRYAEAESYYNKAKNTLAQDASPAAAQARAIIFVTGAQTWLNHGWVGRARSVFNQLHSLPGVTANPGMAPLLANLEIALLREEGHFKDAMALGKAQIKYWESNNPSDYKPVMWPGSQPDKDQTKMAGKRLAAYAHVLAAGAVLGHGNYEQGHDEMAMAMNHASRLTSKKDPAVLRGHYYQGRALLEQGQLSSAATAFDQVLKHGNSSKNFVTTHPHYVQALYYSTLTNVVQGDLGRAVRNMDRLEDLYIARFNRAPQIGAMLATLQYEEEHATRVKSPGNYDVKNFYPHRNTVLPIAPATYVAVLQRVQLRQLETDSIAAAIRVQEELDRTLESWPKDAPMRHVLELESSYFHAMMGGKYDRAEKAFATSFNKVVAPQLHPRHILYTRLANLHGRVYEVLDHYEKARLIFDRNLANVRQHHGPKTSAYANQLEKLGRLELTAGRFAPAEKLLKESADLYRDLEGKRSFNVLRVEEGLGRLYADLGMFGEAEELLKNADEHYVPTYHNLADYSPEGSEDLARLQLMQGRYRKAEEQLQFAIIRRGIFGNDNHLLIGPKTVLAQLYLDQGDLAKGERTAREASDIARRTFGDTSLVYVRARMVQQRALTLLGDNERSVKLAQANLNDLRHKFGNTLGYAEALTDLATAQMRSKGYSPESEQLLVQARNLAGSIVGTSHPFYGHATKNLAASYIERKSLDSAAQMLEQAGTIFQARLGKKNSSAADLFILQGDLHLARGNFSESEKSYEKGRDIYSKIFDKGHPKYVSAQGRLARLLHLQGKRSESMNLLQNTRDANLAYMSAFFPYLSENERNNYWQLLRSDFEFFNTVATANIKEKPRLAADMLENSMASKAVLLSGMQKVRNRIMAGSDTSLVRLYRRWQYAKEQLLSRQGQNLDVEARGELAELKQETDELERDLARRSAVFARATQTSQHNWKDVRNALNDNEVLVDLVRYRHYSQRGFTDSVIYAALIVTRKSDQPRLVLLPNGRLLEKRNIEYYRNAIKHSIQDDRSYALFWKPIKEHIPDNALIYVSNDGIFNQLNIETLYNPATKKFAVDENTLVLINTPKDLLNRKEASTASTTPVAMLVGNPRFYASRLSKDLEDSLRDEGLHLAPLPGTRKEIDMLAKMLAAKKYKTLVAQDSAATENVLKHSTSPGILHLASHGCFFNEEQHMSQRMSMELLDADAENGMERTGLALYKAGELLRKGSAAMNSEDGILTAAEAMTLNLDQTDLVVLSACESGRGTVQAGEGVYGLQRALQVAGARTVVMSLFKVEDNVTFELMQGFYQRWLNSPDRRTALADAKRELKKQYPDPIYWGGFIMLGN